METTEEIVIRPITSDEQYNEVMQHINRLIDSERGSRDFEILHVLSILADDYENKHYPILPLSPIEAIRHQMNELGLSQQDVAPYFGGANRVSEVLNGKRKLTLKMVREISRNLHISPATLLAID